MNFNHCTPVPSSIYYQMLLFEFHNCNNWEYIRRYLYLYREDNDSIYHKGSIQTDASNFIELIILLLWSTLWEYISILCDNYFKCLQFLGPLSFFFFTTLRKVFFTLICFVHFLAYLKFLHVVRNKNERERCAICTLKNVLASFTTNFTFSASPSDVSFP